MGLRHFLLLSLLAFGCGRASGDVSDSGGSSGQSFGQGGRGGSSGASQGGAPGGSTGSGRANLESAQEAFSPTVWRILGGWMDAISSHCEKCDPDNFQTCLRQNFQGYGPLAMLCYSQLEETDPLIGSYLERWATAAESNQEVWSQGHCPLPSVSELEPQPGSSSVDAQCLPSQVRCLDGSKAWYCDNEVECPSGEDERYCGPIQEQFVCEGGATVPWVSVCDGEPDCEQSDDERWCFARE